MINTINFEQLRLGKDDRGLLVGATGCGKTTLANFLLQDRNKPYVVVYDAKISDSISKWNEYTFCYTLSSLEEEEAKKLVYRPSIYDSVDSEKQDEFFQWVYNRKYTRLYIDEAYALLGGANPAFHLQACLSRGRERGISTLIATQRPKRIPLITMSEAEHIYIFRLNLLEDKNRVYELTGIDIEEQNTLNNYEFFYYNALSGFKSKKLKLKI